MKIAYIHHNSFITELDHVVPLFDYFKRNIPEIDRERPSFVFASHRHESHFSRSILDLEESHGNVIYVLPDDIWTRQVSEDPLGRTISLEPGEEVSLKDGIGNPMDIRAFESIDQDVASLASLEGRTIYHARDLSNWMWEGEPKADNRRMSENFRREMDKLTGRHIDVVFVLTDPRQEKDPYLGTDDFVRTVGADVVFPIHFWKDFQAAARFKALACADGYRDRIQEIHRRGEEFLV